MKRILIIILLIVFAVYFAIEKDNEVPAMFIYGVNVGAYIVLDLLDKGERINTEEVHNRAIKKYFNDIKEFKKEEKSND